jgi:hypothetical protein
MRNNPKDNKIKPVIFALRELDKDKFKGPTERRIIRVPRGIGL